MNKIAGNTFDSGDLQSIINITSPGLKPTLGENIGIIIPWIFGAGGIALLFYIVIGGYQIMLSGGNPKTVAAGKSKLTNAIVGFLILSASYLIVMAVATMLGLETIKSIF